MKKDLQSYHVHDKDYKEKKEFYLPEAIISRTEESSDFERTGFELALAITKDLPKVHVDIGCGVGWLLRKMSPSFGSSIGIEPSSAALEAARRLTRDCNNVSFIQADMADAFDELPPHTPIFFTTGAVLSHIEDFHVKTFLKKLDTAQDGSALFFSENYDRNIQWGMWHIRSKEWWRKHLPSWQLIFLDISNSGYPSGIYGVKKSKEHLVKTFERTTLWNTYWIIDKFNNIYKRGINKIAKNLFSKEIFPL